MRPPRGSRLLRPVAGVAVVVWALLTGLAVAVRGRDGSPFGWDSGLHGWVLGHRPEVFTDAAVGLTDSATAVPAYAVVALAGVLGAPLRGRTAARGRARVVGGLTAVLALAAGQLVRGTLARSVARPRPPVADWLRHVSGPSFPSGHTTTAALVAVIVCAALRRGRPVLRGIGSAVAVTWALGVGLTRVYLGVHWPSDVLAGWLLVAGLAAVVAALVGAGPCWSGDPVLRATDPGRSP